jgi:hypothetical protein
MLHSNTWALEISFLIKLVNLELYLVWMGKTESDVMKDE